MSESHQNKRCKSSAGTVTALYNKMLDEQDKVAQGWLVPLPRSPNVHELLGAYYQRARQRAAAAAPAGDTLDVQGEQLAARLRGFEEMFNVALGRALLYKEERTQLARILEQQRQMRTIADPARLYGVEHLARLLVWLPEFLADVHQELDAQERALVLHIAQDMLSFVAENMRDYWCSSYTHAVSPRTPGGRQAAAAAAAAAASGGGATAAASGEHSQHSR